MGDKVRLNGTGGPACHLEIDDLSMEGAGVHGGLSLQELAVPHLTITQQVMGRPVGVRAELPRVIASGQPQVTLQSISTSVFDQPRQVTLSLEKAGEPVIPPLSFVVSPGEPKTVDVFLPLGCDLERGDQVRWLLRDAVTDEVLAEQEATSLAS